MPATIASYAAGALFSSGFVSTAIFVANYGAAILSVGAFALTTTMSNRAKRQAEDSARASARASYNASLRDVSMIVDNPLVPRNIVLGTARTSGPLWPWFTYGSVGDFHTFGVILAGHECDAITSVFFNEDQVTLDAGGRVTGPAKYCKTTTVAGNEAHTGGAPGLSFTLAHVPTTGVQIVAIPQGANPQGFTAISYFINDYARVGDTFTINEDTTGYDVMATYSYTRVETLFEVAKFLGQPGQAASQDLIFAAAASGNPTAWDATRVGEGICYLVVKMKADFNVLGDIGVPKVSAMVRGVKAYDPRTGLTVWTENPAVLARWFLVESPYSPKTLAIEVDEDEVIASANVCDELVAFSAAKTAKRYTCNGILFSQEIPLSNLNHILDAMDGDALPISGKWQLVAGYYRIPNLPLNEASLSDANITIAPYTQKSDLFNAITGNFVSPAFGYQAVSYDMVTNAVYQAEDGDEVLPQSMDFALVDDAIRCQMIAWQRLTRARNGQTIQLGTSLKGYDTSPLRNVSVQLRELLGDDPKVFAVRRREFNGPRLTYTLQETSPEVWAWDYTKANAVVEIPNTTFPDFVTMPILQGVTASSGTAELLRLPNGSVVSRIRLVWEPVQNVNVSSGGLIRWQYREVNSSVWLNAIPAMGSDIEAFIYPVEDGKIYQLQSRCTTGNGREGDWSPAFLHMVVGKTEPPPDVTSFTIDGNRLTWSDASVADLAGYLIRFNYGPNRFWGAAAPLHGGILTSSPYVMTSRPSGVCTFLIKAIDTTGLESTNAAAITINLGDALVENILMSWPEAPTFSGTITNGSVVGSVLKATATDLFFGDPDQPFFGPDTEPFFPAGTYSPMTYRWSQTPTSSGSVGLLHSISASDYSIRYKRGSQGAFFGVPTDLFFGPADEPFFGEAGAFATWPGSLAVAQPEAIEFEITTAGGPTQGQVSVATVVLDVPDILESFSDLVISAAGTRLPITRAYRVIAIVNPAVQHDGNGGVSVVVEDKHPTLGPLITVRNAAGVAVTGLIDVEIQGY